jgi:serine/threonine protein kinase
LHLSNLVGFSNLGRRTADIDRALSYTVRERATGVLFNIDILDADDYRFIRSAASAHRLVGDDFLKRQNDDCSLYLPVGIDFSNGKVVRWFEYADPLPLWFRRFSQSVSPSVPVVSSRLTLPLPVLKNWFRQIFQAVRKIHATGAAHGSIVPRYIYLVSSDEPSTTSLKIACPSLFPIVSADVGSIAQDWKYTCPEVLLARSKGLTSVPTPSGDIWSIGCILAEIVRQGVPLFGKEDWDDKKLRKISRMVGRPPSQRPSLRSDFPLDSMVSQLNCAKEKLFFSYV